MVNINQVLYMCPGNLAKHARPKNYILTTTLVLCTKKVTEGFMQRYLQFIHPWVCVFIKISEFVFWSLLDAAKNAGGCFGFRLKVSFDDTMWVSHYLCCYCFPTISFRAYLEFGVNIWMYRPQCTWVVQESDYRICLDLCPVSRPLYL